MYYVYIVKCRDRTFYTGYTNSPVRRLLEHAAGKGSRYVRARGVAEMRTIRTFRVRGRAMGFERVVKRMPRQEKRVLFAGGEVVNLEKK